MDLFQAFILGIIQGLTEFIPVSSTAHLLIGQQILGIEVNERTFGFLVLVQLGTILSLVIYFRQDVWELFLAFFQKPFSSPANRLAWLIIIATMPALIAGFLLRETVSQIFSNPLQGATIRLFISALILVLAERIGKRTQGIEDIKWSDALAIGAAQVIAIFPGASRSGTAIFGGMLRNMHRRAAARFAFLMAIPVMVAAGAYELIEVIKLPNTRELIPAYAVGFLTAAIVGWLAVKWLLNYLADRSLYVFAAYCVLAGTVLLIVQWVLV